MARRRSPFGSDSLNGKVVTYFFTNFPEGETEHSMWKTFESQGAVVDLFIARKRSRRGRRFGFVRFVKVNDRRRLEERLNGIWIGKYHLRVNLERFRRAGPRKYPPSNSEQGSRSAQRTTFHQQSRGAHRTYADVVKEVNGGSLKSSRSEDVALKKLVLSPPQEALENLESSLIGELKSFDFLNSIGILNSIEGWPECHFSYLGGLTIQLEFTSKSGAQEFLEGAANSWRDWFCSLHPWRPDFVPVKRIALLEIQGLPLHVWHKDYFGKVGQLWGDVVRTEVEGSGGRKKTGSFAYVLTDTKDWIMEVVEVSVGDMSFSVRVMERAWDSWEEGEIIDSDADSASRKPTDDGSSSWEGMDDVSFGMDPSTSNRQKSPAPILPVAIELGVKEDEGASTGSKENLLLDNFSRKIPMIQTAPSFLGVPDGHVTSASSHHGPVDKSPAQFSARSTQISETIFLQKSNPSFDDAGDGLECNRMTDVADSDAMDAVEEGWPPHSKFDGIERRRRRTKKMKRIRSPCNCNRWKKGLSCKHSKEIGGLVGEVFFGGRDTQESSDSECLIKSSNQRLLNQNVPSHSTSLDSPILDSSKLNSVGKAIGLRTRLMLKVLSWNINDMGKETKRAEHKISFLCLQETKTSICHDWQVNSVWGRKNCNFVALDSSEFCQAGWVYCFIWLVAREQLSVGHHQRLSPTRREIQKNSLGLHLKRVEKGSRGGVGCLRGIGDFNEVRTTNKRRGSTFDQRGAKAFNDFISEAGLLDLQLGGRKYTWMNASCTKSSKLDRFLVNSKFLDLWPASSSLALPRVLSNHCPIILDTKSADFGPIPFKFFNSWLANQELDDLVKRKWEAHRPEFDVPSKIERLSRKLRHLKATIITWRKDVNKAMDIEAEELKKKIAAIDLLADTGHIDDTMVKERVNFTTRLEDTIAAKVSDLKQKAKLKWLIHGDENSSFYHGIVNQKLKSTRIHGLNINGIWVTDPNKIKVSAQAFFEQKFEERYKLRPTLKSSFFRILSEKNELEVPFSEQEVKNAVWSCGHNKAPGPDGFTFEFLRKF
ncbi:LOW QUALITY PROTEIN: hypothetical protein OSB04_006322 [Centaurea solstitialis]|uniref:RRM domain-containing protein n=1 Tax=Centaurea solstitialis TaxID=347529 RepID=A0AA38U0V1_9ASTR|nr:LOW QUALITY PROTEIN: hypothetical protein OSB04_006322 [Centaurea solstitialis]